MVLTVCFYADDTQLYISLNSSNKADRLSSLQHCLKDITTWLNDNKLVCNQRKTEIVHFTSRFRQKDQEQLSINLNGIDILPCAETRNLGIVLDSQLLLNRHVNNICISTSIAIRNIGKIRKYIGPSETARLIHAYVTSKLDHCNSVLYGLPDHQLSKLQRIQNTAARVITRTKQSEHIQPVLYNLHWLPIKQRIVYKILLLTYKVLNGLCPDYLRELIERYRPGRALRSSGLNLLTVPSTNTAFYGDTAFSVAAPKLWNSLPKELKNSETLENFQKNR